MKRLFAAVALTMLALVGTATASTAGGAECYELPVGSFVGGTFVPNPAFLACKNG